MKKAIFCISIDHELLWGRKDLDYSSFIPRVKKERQTIKRLLFLFDKYQVPTTWAVVGKVFKKGDPLWYGADTIKEIKKHKDQEIGSHSFSHEIFKDISPEKAELEVKQCRGLKSFVFPRNLVKYLHILKKYNFKSYRGPDAYLPLNVTKKIYRLLQMIDFVLLIPHTANISRVSGLINIPGTMYFPSARGIRKHIPQGMRFLKAKFGIDKAIEEKKLFHLWFHPVDFSDDSKKLFSDLEKILEYASNKRDLGQIDIKTMGQIANLK